MADPGWSAAELSDILAAAAPFAGGLGVTITAVSVSDDQASAAARLPVRDGLGNHRGHLHAGVLFTLGLTASVALVSAAFADLATRVSPAVAGAEIVFRRPVAGPAWAVAELQGSVSAVAADVDIGSKARFDVEVTIGAADEPAAAGLKVHWVMT
jgi:acyl-coenzyme A thioesterase PaaI-like protein